MNQAMEDVKQAVEADYAGDYQKAFDLYMNALEYFKGHLKNEKNPKIREAIRSKFDAYLKRANEIKLGLDFSTNPTTGLGSSLALLSIGCSVVPFADIGENSQREQEIKEYANSFKEKGIEYVKEAIEEDKALNYEGQGEMI